MYKKAAVASLIKSGKKLYLAADESMLSQLPKGQWIGGTIPYFMAEQGGKVSRDEIFVTELPKTVVDAKIVAYDDKSIASVYEDAYDNGFSLIVIPATSPVHLSFAMNAAAYKQFAKVPLVGWITGMHLSDLGKVSAKVVDGQTGKISSDRALVFHCKLAKGFYADVGIVNIFEQGDGDTITFSSSGWTTEKAFVNGKEVNFADYIKSKKLDIRLPLVADYTGTRINISFQSVEGKSGKVTFYAPFFEGVEYKQAKPIDNYVERFVTHMPKDKAEKICFSCNCILNFLYSELEGKQTGHVVGPITFGEIVYQLLNQTLAYLTIEKE